MIEGGVTLRKCADDGDGNCQEDLASDGVVRCIQLQVTENPTLMGLNN